MISEKVQLDGLGQYVLLYDLLERFLDALAQKEFPAQVEISHIQSIAYPYLLRQFLL